MLRTTLAVLLACAALFVAPAATPQTAPVEVYVFWQRGCTHCERALSFLMRLDAREAVDVRYFEVRTRSNARLYRAAVEALAVQRLGVPLTAIGSAAIVGYLDDASTGAEIDARLAECARARCASPLAALAAELEAVDDSALAAAQLGAPPAAAPTVPAPSAAESGEPQLHIPFVGEVELRDLSLPVLTLALAAVDGFNPCALWVLVFLIGLLLGHSDALRRWLLGGLFLLTTAVVYYLLIAAWLNALLVLGAAAALRIAVGVAALGGGAYYAYRYFTTDASCRVGGERRQRIMAGLRAAAREPRFAAAAVAIVVLAIGVNFVELLCSAGIPAVYTQILALTPMPAWEYHAWLAAYVLVFLGDDVAIFVTAMLTLEIAGAHRYAHRAQLLGALALLTVGVLLILRPEWLTFG